MPYACRQILAQPDAPEPCRSVPKEPALSLSKGSRPLSCSGPSPVCHIQYWYRLRYNEAIMKTARKITVEVPAELLERAQLAGGTGITQTVRTGLQLVAASQTYARLRQLRGKVRFTRKLAELKADR